MILLFAFFTMLIDHVGFLFFPDYEIFRLIGRLSFPLFAWGIVRGFKLTKDKFNYTKRLFILAIISQIPFILVFGFSEYNIVFTLLFGLLSIILLDEIKLNIYLKYSFLLFLIIVADLYNFDYGMYGVLTIILIYVFWQQKKLLLFFSMLTVIFFNIDYSKGVFVYDNQIFSAIALLILYIPNIQKYDFKLNFYFKYLFYPLHLLALYFINLLI